MADSDKLLQGLQAYRTALDKHLSLLQEDLQQLENRWLALDAVYEGEAAEQFRASWLRTVEWFADYIYQMQEITAILNERIDALEQANLLEGGLM